MPKYVKGAFPCTVFETETGTLYVRKSLTVNRFVKSKRTGRTKFVKQKQVWRVCEPPTEKRAGEILFEIEAGIFYGKKKILSDEVLFEIFGEVQNKKIDFGEFVKRISEWIK